MRYKKQYTISERRNLATLSLRRRKLKPSKKMKMKTMKVRTSTANMTRRVMQVKKKNQIKINEWNVVRKRKKLKKSLMTTKSMKVKRKHLSERKVPNENIKLKDSHLTTMSLPIQTKWETFRVRTPRVLRTDQFQVRKTTALIVKKVWKLLVLSPPPRIQEGKQYSDS